jgi:chemotaxis protein methyltransferase CheR
VKGTENNYSEELEKIEIGLLLQGIYDWCGYDFREYAYNTIRRRVLHRMQEEKLNSVTGLLDKALHDPACLSRLIHDFSINVTEMYRNPSFFLSFRENVVPFLRTYPTIRIWHAGCSTGEEVYSMAILLDEEGLYEKTKIYATDIDTDALKRAKSGIFPINHMQRNTSNYINAGGKRVFSDYYTVSEKGVKFHTFLSKNILFAQHNLATDESFNEFNVIVCRNVLIYFNKYLKRKVFDLLYRSLSMFGVLGLGDKEVISDRKIASCFEEIDADEKLYRKIV